MGEPIVLHNEAGEQMTVYGPAQLVHAKANGWKVGEGAEQTAPSPDATDAAVELAAAHGINLTAVTGSGADGRILKSDVQALID